MCDNRCIARCLTVISGTRNLSSGLWGVKFEYYNTNQLNYIINRDKNKAELAHYLHAFTFSLVTSIFQKSIKKGNRHYNSINQSELQKLQLKDTLIKKDHKIDKFSNEDEDNFLPKINEKNNNCFYQMVDLEKEAKSNTNLTRRFPHQSNRVNN